MDELSNLAIEGAEVESLSWKEERQETIEMVESCIETNGEMDIGQFSRAINYWQSCAEISLADLKTTEELKKGFSYIMKDEFVVRHYFETEWIILAQDTHIKIDFTDVYKY